MVLNVGEAAPRSSREIRIFQVEQQLIYIVPKTMPQIILKQTPLGKKKT